MTARGSRSLRRLFRTLLMLLCASTAATILVSCGKERGKGEADTKAGTAAQPGGIQWLTSYDSALAAARDKGRPVMIDFYTDWCGWCKRLDAETYVDGQVVKASADFISVKINADQNQQVATRYNITGFPTILFLDSIGNEIHRVIGYRPPQVFLGEMATALAVFKERS